MGLDGADWVGRLTDPALERVIDAGTLARAREYAHPGRIRSLGTADRGRVLVAEVAGGRARPYSTLVTRLTDGEVPTWVGRCSCPVGQNCKHCVAVLLMARAELAGGSPETSNGPYAASLADADRLGIAGSAGRLFTGQASWRGEGVRNVPAWARALEPMVSVEDELDGTARTPLAVMVSQVERGTRVPGERVVGLALRPTRLSRAGTWTASWGWDQALGPLAARSMPREHAQLGLELCRLAQATASVGFNHRPQSVDLGSLGPDFWPWLDKARAAGVELVPGPAASATRGTAYRSASRSGTRGASRLSLPEVRSVVVSADPVTAEIDVVRRARGLALRANLTGVPGIHGTEPAADLVEHRPRHGGVVVRPLGSPVHGVVVVDDGVMTLAPIVPVLPTGFDAMFDGGELVVPAADVERFLAFYYPRLRRRLRVVSSDESVDLPEPEPIRLHLRLHAHAVDDVEVTPSFAYPGSAMIPVDARDRWADRDVGVERDLVARLGVLDGLPGLRWREPGGGFRLAPSVHARGLAAASFVRDPLPTWLDHPDLVVEGATDLAAYEQSTETPLIEWTPTTDDDRRNDWFDLRVSVTVGGESVPFEPLFQALARHDEVMLLDSGTWFSLEHPSLDRLRTLIEEARALGDPVRDGVSVSRFHVDLFGELLELGIVDREIREWAGRMLALRDGIVTAEADVPVGVKAELRPYQRDGFQWLATLWDAGLGGVLADDMGLGKTLQTLALIQRAHDRGELTAPVLVVAPTSVLSTWLDEAERFTPDLSVVIVGETSRRRRAPLGEVVGAAQVVVTSYAVFRIDAEAFRELRWRALVLDEAQALKNSASQTYQAARRLRAPFKLVLTGTPLENSLMDLWSLLSVAAPGLYPRRELFSEQYRRPIESGRAPELLERLRRRIRPLMLRRTKEEVARELPPKQVQVLPVALHPVHQRIYDQHLQRERARLLGLLDDPGANRIAILASLTRLRQLSLDPVLVDASYAGRAVSAKITELVDHLVELRQEGHRALVFSQFTSYLRIVEQVLADEGIATTYLDGRTRNRPAVIERFRSGDATAFLISLKAGGVGLTLTEADYVFVLDPWWNPATEAQAVDRAHRIGQTRPVMVYRMVSSGTIEDKVVALQDKKRELFARVVDGEGAEALGGAITAADIKALLAD